LNATQSVSRWDELVRAIQARFSVPEEVDNEEKFKKGAEEKKDDEEEKRDEILPEIDPNEAPKYTIFSETDPKHKIIPESETKFQNTQILLHEIPPQISESLEVQQIPDREGLYQNEKNLGDARLHPKFELRHTKSGMQPLRGAEMVLLYADGLDFVALKHRWRWKHAEGEEEDAAAVEEAPKCEKVTSTCSAGEQFGQEAMPPGCVDAGVEKGQLAVARVERDSKPDSPRSRAGGPGTRTIWRMADQQGSEEERGAWSFQINHFWPTSKGQRNGRFSVNKEEEEKTLEARKTVR